MDYFAKIVSRYKWQSLLYTIHNCNWKKGTKMDEHCFASAHVNVIYVNLLFLFLLLHNSNE